MFEAQCEGGSTVESVRINYVPSNPRNQHFHTELPSSNISSFWKIEPSSSRGGGAAWSAGVLGIVSRKMKQSNNETK